MQSEKCKIQEGVAEFPRVGIVVLNFNGKADTFACLESLGRLTYLNVHIYLVDNGSSEPIVEEAREKFSLHAVTVIANRENLGFTGGNNIGCRSALRGDAEYVLMLNNDTVVAPNFLEPLVEACRADRTVAIATPKILFYEDDGAKREIWACGAKVNRWLGRSPHIGVYECDRGQYDHLREVERVTGCAMLLPRRILEREGLLDNRFFIYEEELEFCLRLRRRGYRLHLVPRSVIWHKGHRDTGRLGRPFTQYLQTRNHLLLLRLHSDFFRLGGSVALCYLVAAIVKNFLRALLHWVMTRERVYSGRAVLAGILDAFRGRFGKPTRF